MNIRAGNPVNIDIQYSVVHMRSKIAFELTRLRWHNGLLHRQLSTSSTTRTTRIAVTMFDLRFMKNIW